MPGGGLNFGVPVQAAKVYGNSVNADAQTLAAAGAVAGRPFVNLVTSFETGNSAGVSDMQLRYIDQQGLPIDSNVSTNFTIQGSGFGVVRDVSGNLGSVRDCSFYDNNGIVENLAGQRLQVCLNANLPATGSQPAIQNMETLNIGNLVSSPAKTQNLSINAQINGGAALNETFPQSVTVYDSLGNSKSLLFTWTRINNSVDPYAGGGTQAWSLKVSDPTGAGAGIPAPYLAGMRVEFNDVGNPIKFNTQTGGVAADNPPPLVINWPAGNGAAQSSIALNLGSVGTNSGVTSTGSKSTTVNISQDGNPPGVYQSMSIDRRGFVFITYTDGLPPKQYGRVALFSYKNANALNERAPGVFEQTSDSGGGILNFPGENGTGLLVPGTYEGSAVNATQAYLQMIKDQQDLVGNFKSITTIKEILNDLKSL